MARSLSDPEPAHKSGRRLTGGPVMALFGEGNDVRKSGLGGMRMTQEETRPGAQPSAFEAHTPQRIAELVETSGVGKANLPVLKILLLAVLAGAFISLGAMVFTVTVTGSDLGLGPTRLLGGLAFSLGLILVVVGGAELFTGNSLMVMAWVDGKIEISALARNWVLVYLGNLAGAVATAVIAWRAGILEIGGGAVLETATRIAISKFELSFEQNFWRGLLCNVLVCLAVWLCVAARSVPGKILAILFPISAFVAIGLEHSVANMYFLPIAAFSGVPEATLARIAGNILPVTLGNMVGGGGFVAFIYWMIYRRP